jgi:hypothetical protein
VTARDVQTAFDEMVANALPIEESARLARDLLNRIGSVDAEAVTEGACSDCGVDGPRYTFGASRRPLCTVCARARKRAGIRGAA